MSDQSATDALAGLVRELLERVTALEARLPADDDQFCADMAPGLVYSCGEATQAERISTVDADCAKALEAALWHTFQSATSVIGYPLSSLRPKVTLRTDQDRLAEITAELDALKARRGALIHERAMIEAAAAQRERERGVC